MTITLRQMKKYVNSPLVQLGTGLILLISGVATAYREFTAADQTLQLGVHHGVILWALVQVLGSLPDLFDGLDRSIEAMEQHRGA